MHPATETKERPPPDSDNAEGLRNQIVRSMYTVMWGGKTKHKVAGVTRMTVFLFPKLKEREGCNTLRKGYYEILAF